MHHVIIMQSLLGSSIIKAGTRQGRKTMSGAEFLSLLLIVSLVTALTALIYGTFARNKWGINIARVVCPNCGTALPRWRRPTSFKQGLWGGYTCPSCHCELDKWGREVSPR
jgi:predicted RNA-binding Zn-ribbon protein involved in translation (DUF1610 family)